MLESAISPMNNSNIELILKSFLNAQRRLGVFRMILYCSEELFSLDRTLPADDVSDSNDSIFQSSTDYVRRGRCSSVDFLLLLPLFIRITLESAQRSRRKSRKHL